MDSYFNDILLDKISTAGEITTRVDSPTNENLKFNSNFLTVNDALYDYSKQFFNAAYLIMSMVAEKCERDDVTEQCPIGYLYFLRHSVELILKAIIYKQNKSQSSVIFSNCKHELLQLSKNITFGKLCKNELDLMESYFTQIDAIDSMGDLFRYPFDEVFLRTYHNKFFDIYKMFYIYALYYE